MTTQHQRMTAGDQMMHMGDSSPNRRSTMVNMEILDGVPDWDRFVHTMDRLSRVISRFRQRVVVPTLPTTAPRWVVDPDFDLNYHLRRVQLPEPGTLRHLLDMVEVIASSPLDPARPLWTATLVEGLEGGRSAVVHHLSHVVADGVGGVAMAMELYDFASDAPERPMPPMPTPHDLTPNELTRQGISELPKVAVGRARSLLGVGLTAVRRPKRTAEFVSSLGRVLSAGATEPSPLLTRRGITRRVITMEIDLQALKSAGKKYEGSINDAYVAGLTLALGKYHETMGVPLDKLPMAVPVNLRKEGDSLEGNAFTGVSLAAPIGEPDLGKRVRDIRDQIRSGRDEVAVDIMGLMAPAVVALPVVLLAEMDGSLKVPDVQASNVASYPVDTWIAGQKVVAQYGLGPLPGVGMMATMVSRNGTCHIAFRYDTLAFENDAVLAQSLYDGYSELLGGTSGLSLPDQDPWGDTPWRDTKVTTSEVSRDLVKKAATQKAPTKKAVAEKAPAVKPEAEKPDTEKPDTEKPTAEKSAAEKSAAKTAPAKKAAAKTAPAKTAPAKKAAAKKAPARKAAAKKAPAKKAAAEKAVAPETSAATPATTPVVSTPDPTPTAATSAADTNSAAATAQAGEN